MTLVVFPVHRGQPDNPVRFRPTFLGDDLDQHMLPRRVVWEAKPFKLLGGNRRSVTPHVFSDSHHAIHLPRGLDEVIPQAAILLEEVPFGSLNLEGWNSTAVKRHFISSAHP